LTQTANFVTEAEKMVEDESYSIRPRMRFGQNPKPKNEKISDRPVKEKSKSVSQIRKQTPFEVK